MANFDVLKYGFILLKEDGDARTYEYKVAGMTICLIDVGDMFTLYYIQKDRSIDVANRYIVEKQEQLDFLIYNGRLGYLFK